MAIITISRGSYSKGREVAEKVAARLGYQLVHRDVLIEASDRFHIPEVKLVRAIHDAPSILERFTMGKQSYIAYVRSALVSRAVDDNIVYHGLAGHLLLQGISHVVKIRIIADMDSRVAEEMKRENISAAEARALLQKDDAERRKWTASLYGVDPWDPSLYDLVINIKNLDVDDAVELVIEAAGRTCFMTTAESQQKLVDLDLACRVKAALLLEESLDVAVTSEYGNVLVYTKPGLRQTGRLEHLLDGLRRSIPGLNNLELRSGMPFPPSAV